MVEGATAFRVQVCHATPRQTIVIDLEVNPGTSLESAIAQSGILNRVPEIDLQTCKVGIFGKVKTLDTPLRNRDRVEIYRPLIADPKDARRRRVAVREKAR